MSKPAIGKILSPENLPPRDAIHIPIIPVLANDILSPGERVSLFVTNSGELSARRFRPGGTLRGVVDPFLSQPVLDGDYFYCFLRPGSVQKLWHEWTHPEIDKLLTN